MTLLARDETLRARSAVANAELAPLADALAAELAPLFGSELYVPTEKALLSRAGGRCARDGATLEFDPFSPHEHRCPVCSETYTGELHHRFWVFWYQLWLIERALHAAVLGCLRCDTRSTALAARIVERYCDEYLLYPNRDNVLGPTRLFFSTYLESIWLLNLCIAVDLLEGASAEHVALGARARERIIEPSAEIIGIYDEGASNRQVWNDAALMAANFLLGRRDRVEHALRGPSGILYHLQTGLLKDGTWYEGENYHLFAHRGLWYGVTMAECAGIEVPDDLLARFQEGFATPFLTALPDMTLPSRRDSQYAISLRQSRFAELCELGLARQSGDGDARLRGVLFHLYEDDVPRAEIGRARSTADVERNLGGTSLSRADLGWRSLLFARPTLPPLQPEPLGTVLLEGQGLAVFRRDRERIYVALDYGASGGGHGHPDRLNVLLSDGPTRWLDDMGTGSYVDPSLHWYRSTLAHSAPLFNGCEQQRVDGELFAFDERDEVGWACARALDLYPNVTAMRTLVVTRDYVLDELAWMGQETTVMDLPIHIDPAAVRVRRAVPGERLSVHTADAPLEDALGVLESSAGRWIGAGSVARITARSGERTLNGFIVSSLSGVLYRVSAPGPLGKGRLPFLIFRVASIGETACVRAVWDWKNTVETIRADPADAFTTIERRDGSHDRLRQTARGFRIERMDAGGHRVIEVGGFVPLAGRRRSEPADTPHLQADLFLAQPLTFQLMGESYRRSEESWEEAGRPRALIRILHSESELHIDVTVQKLGELTFSDAGSVNELDNERPDINGDGVQLYVIGNEATGVVLVPELTAASSGAVRARVIEGWQQAPGLRATWLPIDGGYAIQVRMPFAGQPGEELRLGVVVNEKPSGRDRRRGQLVLGGAAGEFIYLRGDREDRRRLPRFRIMS